MLPLELVQYNVFDDAKLIHPWAKTPFGAAIKKYSNIGIYDIFRQKMKGLGAGELP